MERSVVTGPGVPKGIGPDSQAVRAEAAGPSFADHARQAFANLDAVLRGGSRPEPVVITTVLVADQADFPELNRLYAEFFRSEPPVGMTMQVPLPRGLLISIGCTAIADDNRP